MNQTRRIIGWAALIWLGLWAGGCAAPGNPTPGETNAPASSPLASLAPSATPDLSYPGPQTTQPFDPLTAYPGMAEMRLTATSQILTLTAMPTRTMTPTITPSLTPTIVPTRGPLAKPLPAPLYFISPHFMVGSPLPQIWRLERDGYGLKQITHEEKGVGEEYFDVAADGRLAYTSNNSLIVTDAYGSNRQVVVRGKEQPSTFDDMFASDWYLDKEAIDAPAWSPDGSKIAYYQDGTNLLDLKKGKTFKLIEGPKYKKDLMGTDIPENGRAFHYLPIDWTPDGRYVILKAQGYEYVTIAFVTPESNSKAISIETLIGINSPRGSCCDYSFTEKGQFLFPTWTDSSASLWLIDLATQKGEILTQQEQLPSKEFPMISFPAQGADSRIYFFSHNSGPNGNSPDLLAYTDSKTIPFHIPEDVTFVGSYPGWSGMLWLPDASGVILRDNILDLALMDAQTGKVTPLGIQGTGLHWGVGSEQ